MLALVVTFSLGFASVARAGGPLLVATDGSAVGWDVSKPVPYRTDVGRLGAHTHKAAVRAVRSGFAAWSDISSAAIRYQWRGDLEVNVDVDNFGPYLGPFGGSSTPLGKNVVVFDADGSIFDLLFGIGTTVAGFASPTFASDGTTTVSIGDPIPPRSHIIEGLIFLNGKFLDGVLDPVAANPEVTAEFFQAVFVHEIGHFSGLGHTQIHGLAHPPSTDLPGTTSPVETMFPILIETEQATPKRDDRAWLSKLYPAPSFAALSFAIEGRVLDANGLPAPGVNVIARNLQDDADAVSVVSGFDGLGTGKLSLPGLKPGARYRVETQEIDFPFVDGSSVGPFSPPVHIEAPPEGYSGPAESPDPSTDDPSHFVPLTATAGNVLAGVDIRLNLQRFALMNALFDAPGEWSALTGFAFGDFDSDGLQDMVSSQFGFAPGNLLRLHHGLGNGSFAAPITIDRFPGDFTVVTGQFNVGVDHFLDFAAASVTLNSVRIYFGNGQGGFASPEVALDRSDAEPFAILNIEAGRVNRDPFTDLVVTVEDRTAQGFMIYSLLGSPSGAFTAVATYLAAGDAVPRTSKIEIVDATGDRFSDILALDNRETPVLAMLEGDGTGAFRSRAIDLGAFCQRTAGDALTTGDFNRDGAIDVVVTDAFPVGGAPNFTRTFGDVLLGDGHGGFSFGSRFEIAESFPTAMVSTDLNADGKLDVAVTGAWYRSGKPGSKVTLAFGDGAGGVTDTEAVWGLPPWPRQLATADLDGDACPDLIVGTSLAAPSILPTVESNFVVLRQRSCGFSAAVAAQRGVSVNGTDWGVPDRVGADGCPGRRTHRSMPAARPRWRSRSVHGFGPCAG